MHATALPVVGKPVVSILAHPASQAAAYPALDVDVDLPKHLGKNGARYTSYPRADRVGEEFGNRDYLHAFAGLLTVGPEWLAVTMKGRLLIRNVCMVFDSYLAARGEGPRHTQTV